MIITKGTNSRWVQKQINNDESVSVGFTKTNTIEPQYEGKVELRVRNYTDENHEKYEYFTVYLSKEELERALKMFD